MSFPPPPRFPRKETNIDVVLMFGFTRVFGGFPPPPLCFYAEGSYTRIQFRSRGVESRIWIIFSLTILFVADMSLILQSSKAEGILFSSRAVLPKPFRLTLLDALPYNCSPFITSLASGTPAPRHLFWRLLFLPTFSRYSPSDPSPRDPLLCRPLSRFSQP